MRYIAACEHGRWHLRVHPPGAPHKVRRFSFRCRSWRHSGDCCRWKGAQDFARISEAIDKRADWVYVVLTFRRIEGNDWKHQYKDAFSCWSKLRLRLRRLYGDIPYIQTWERFRKGGLHVNLLIGNAEICRLAKKDRYAWRKLLERHAVACGFGKRTWVEPLRTDTGKSMAGYLVKLARELVGADNKSQIPWDAPPHFRRLRATRGLLPPVHKSGMTGYLVFTPDDGEMPDGEGETDLLDNLHDRRRGCGRDGPPIPTDEHGEVIDKPKRRKR